jgi:oligopeptide/dipeptide ABC transporter ATP-binding protein
VFIDERAVGALRGQELRQMRRRVSIIFQDPKSSLNPTMRVGDIIAEPMVIHDVGTSASRRARVIELLSRVGMDAQMASRYPHEFSGGQRQRISIARALALKPDFVICDEPTSALDVSIQADVIALLQQLKHDMGLTLLFISHNLGVVDMIADRVAVMYLGKIVEIGPASQVIRNPMHPYTKALLSAAPVADPEVQHTRSRIELRGSPPSAIDPPTGCSFHPRCPIAQDGCSKAVQSLQISPDRRLIACSVVAP